MCSPKIFTTLIVRNTYKGHPSSHCFHSRYASQHHVARLTLVMKCHCWHDCWANNWISRVQNRVDWLPFLCLSMRAKQQGTGASLTKGNLVLIIVNKTAASRGRRCYRSSSTPGIKTTQGHNLAQTSKHYGSSDPDKMGNFNALQASGGLCREHWAAVSRASPQQLS